jgi:hypothetical protein
MLVLIKKIKRKKSLARTIKTEIKKKTLIKEEVKTTAIRINFHFLLLSLFVFT